MTPDHLAQILNSTNSMYSYNLRNSNILILLFVPSKTEYWGWKKQFSLYKGTVGIVYQTLLNNRQAKLEVYSNFRTILITANIILLHDFCTAPWKSIFMNEILWLNKDDDDDDENKTYLTPLVDKPLCLQ